MTPIPASTRPPAPRVRLASAPPAVAPSLDEVQERAVEHAGSHLLVVGAPGAGKTTVAAEAFVRAHQDGAGTASEPRRAGTQRDDEAHPALLLTPSRAAATRLRDAVGTRLRAGARRLWVHSASAFAFAVLNARSRAQGRPAPMLIDGPEQDTVIADLLAGHRQGLGAPVVWPESIDPAALELPAFRGELRELMRRAAELGLRPEDLAELGRRHDRPEWEAAAGVMSEYENTTVLGDVTPGRGPRYDDAQILDVAAHVLRTWEEEIPGAPRPRWGRVIVDDYQDATVATARLLDALVADGSELLLLGDPDAALQGFRGGLPALLARATTGEGLGGYRAEQIVLPSVWRGTARLREVTRTVTSQISASGLARHRGAEVVDGEVVDGEDVRSESSGESWTGDGREPEMSGEPRVSGEPRDLSRRSAQPRRPGGADLSVLRSPAQEVAHIARELRVEHLHHATPWSQMAVVVRTAGQAHGFRRALANAGVPTREATGQRPLRSEPAVRPLLLALRAALGRPMAASDAEDLLCSPIGGMDPVSVRGLRRFVRHSVDADPQGTDDLLVELATSPLAAAALPSVHRDGPVQVARVIEAGRQAATRPGTVSRLASAHETMWAIWHATGLAERWRARVLAGGAGAARADADLDAVMALFHAAETFDERQVGSGPEAFLDHLASQDLPADTIAESGATTDHVSVLTASGAAGLEWQVVVLAGVQEDVWPDLRLRDTLLGARALADLETGRAAGGGSGLAGVPRAVARREVLDDELRMLTVAVSRSSRRLVVTAVLDEENRPSAFFDLLRGETEIDDLVRRVPAPLDLRGLVGELRARLEVAVLSTQDGVPDPGEMAPRPSGDEPAEAQAAAAILSALAGHDVPGAAPEQWFGLEPLSTDVPLREPDAVVPVSPSGVEQAHTCPLRWALTRAAGGTREDSTEQSLGTLIHDIAEHHPHGSEDELMAALDERLPALGLGDGWVDRQTGQRAVQMVRRLADYIASVPGVVEAEVEIAARIGRALLTGRVDRLEHVDDDDGPAVRVVDLKTGKTTVSLAEAEEHAQLGSYQAAIEAGALGQDVRSAGARIVQLGASGKPREQSPPAVAEDPAWAAELVAGAAEIMAGAGFEARPNEGCDHCPVRTSCPAQDDGRWVIA